MTTFAARANSKSSYMAHDAGWTPREQRASRAADRQELILRRSALRCGGDENYRYDLLYQRYNQPVAINLELIDIEVWLGIRGAAG